MISNTDVCCRNDCKWLFAFFVFLKQIQLFWQILHKLMMEIDIYAQKVKCFAFFRRRRKNPSCKTWPVLAGVHSNNHSAVVGFQTDGLKLKWAFTDSFKSWKRHKSDFLTYLCHQDCLETLYSQYQGLKNVVHKSPIWSWNHCGIAAELWLRDGWPGFSVAFCNVNKQNIESQAIEI